MDKSVGINPLWDSPEESERAQNEMEDQGTQAEQAQTSGTRGLHYSFQWPSQQAPPPPPNRNYQRLLAEAQDLMTAATRAGQNLEFAEALSVVQQAQVDRNRQVYQPPPPRPGRSMQERANAVEKLLKSFDGSANILDYIEKFELKCAQNMITDSAMKRQILLGKLEGKASTSVRLNQVRTSTYQMLVRYLCDLYCPTAASIKAQLLGLQFKPSVETVREFNARYNELASQAPQGTISEADITSHYLTALAKGDKGLMKDALWGIDLATDTLMEIQQKLVHTLDNYSILSHATGTVDQDVTPAYKAAATGMDASDAASVATAGTSAADLMKSIQDVLTQQAARNAPVAPRTAPVAPAAPVAPVAQPQMQTRPAVGQRTCYNCGQPGHLAFNCPLKAAKLKETVSRAVGIILDRHQAAEAEKEVMMSTSIPVTGMLMPEYAIMALQDLKSAPTQQGQASVMANFAESVADVCRARPTDQKASYYLQKLQNMESKIASEIIDELSKGDATDRILAERLAKLSKGVQVGDRGVEQDLWPGITELLSNLPAKVSVFDMLRQSEAFCRSMVELAMEISMDRGWSIDYATLLREVTAGRATRKFGEYYADKIQKKRLHATEIARIMGGKADSQEAGLQPMESEISITQGLVNATAGIYAAVDAPFDASTMRAQHEVGFGPGIEDLTSLAGPPTPHFMMRIVLNVDGRRVRIVALRDTGAPDTIISKGMLELLAPKAPLKPTSRKFTGIGSTTSQKFLGIWTPLHIQLTPRITVAHSAYVSPENFCLMLLGNDLFNPEVVETLGHHEHRSVMTIRYGNQVDCLPYQQMTKEERQKREKLFQPQPPADALTDYERAIELLIDATQTTRIGYVAESDEAAVAAICDQAAAEASEQVQVADEEQFFDNLAVQAAQEAIEKEHFLW